MVLSCGVRARKALFYKVFAGSYFLSGCVKNRHFGRKWCSKWCSKRGGRKQKFVKLEFKRDAFTMKRVLPMNKLFHKRIFQSNIYKKVLHF